MKLNASEINKILVISLSNVGDVILTFPVIDILRRDFARSKLSVVVGPKAVSLLKGNPHIVKVYIFEKKQSVWNKLRWVLELRKEKFDIVVDLRNTAIPILISAKYCTPVWIVKPKGLHMKLKHLNRLKTVFEFPSESESRYALQVNDDDQRYAESLINAHIGLGKKFIVVGPGAANHAKRWNQEGFAQVCDKLIERYQTKIVFVGDAADEKIAQNIAGKMKNQSVNFGGRTTLTQLAEILRRAALVIANDSAIMHMASYLNVPVVAIFGPTDPAKYGPWSLKNQVVRKDVFCSPCEKPGCTYSQECIDDIQPPDVLKAVEDLWKEIG